MLNKAIKLIKEAKKQEAKDCVEYYKEWFKDELNTKVDKDNIAIELMDLKANDTFDNVMFSGGYFFGLCDAIRILEKLQVKKESGR
jgi:hypothetical protein